MAYSAATRYTPVARRKTGMLLRMFAAWKQRNDLSRLDDKALADIGVTRAQANAETRRPLWDLPANW